LRGSKYRSNSPASTEIKTEAHSISNFKIFANSSWPNALTVIWAGRQLKALAQLFNNVLDNFSSVSWPVTGQLALIPVIPDGRD